uniref:65-kDa microtubule-associated protein 8 n=1 Tax=Aegilops tauschii TaxID=37682 RepID=R7W771_AEGTA
MGSLRTAGTAQRLALPESSSTYLLQELKMIWDEVGQEENERERILEELEQECQEVYRRKPEKMNGTLKEQLNSITPALQEMQMKKEARLKQFTEVQTEVQIIASEIAGRSENEVVTVNEDDLSLKKLEEHQSELQRLKREKGDRLCKVEEYKVLICNFAKIMGMDPSNVLASVHPSLLIGANEQQKKNISDDILNKLNTMVQQLKEEKNHRLEKVIYYASANASVMRLTDLMELLEYSNITNSTRNQENDRDSKSSKHIPHSIEFAELPTDAGVTLQLHSLGKALTNLWNILDTTMEERQPYGQINIFSLTSANGMLGPGSLRLEKIQQIESEVHRLDQLKASKMKELFIKKKAEIEEICKISHMDVPYQTEMDNIMELIMSGDVDHDNLLKTMDGYIYKTKEEATSRKEIMDKVEKWITSCDEERWLEEYSRDERRYSVSRGAHRHLKRAERARIIANKIPVIVSGSLEEAYYHITPRKTSVTILNKWQTGNILLPLLEMLKQYMLTLKEKEEERCRQRGVA